MVITRANFDGHIYRGYPVICPFIMYYGGALLLFTLNYIVYEHLDRSLHVWSSGPTYVQYFRPVPLMVFEIQGFKLKNEKDKIFQLAVGVCCCLQTCNSVVKMLVMGLVLG